MDETAFWQQKLIQLFHVPPGKPYSSFPGSGGHRAIAGKLFEQFTKAALKYVIGTPDWATAGGADRPMLAVRRGLPGRVQVYWPTQPYITHPLAAGYLLDVRWSPTEAEPNEAEARSELEDDLLEDQAELVKEPTEAEPKAEAEARRELRQKLLKDQTEIAEELGQTFADWRDPRQLQNGFIHCWRRFRDELIARNEEKSKLSRGDPSWEEMPADTRCPDHSIWDHLKVTTALAFLKPPQKTKKARAENNWEEGAQEPWLFCFSLGPTQRFISESRTSRDLWVSSFLLADLAWHAMQPFVEHYGPDCIVYPDLRGNPRVDFWLHQSSYQSALREANPRTFAALLPNTFTALVPRGGSGSYLRPLEDLAREAQSAVQKRWAELADTVRNWLRAVVGDNKTWEDIWERQHRGIIYTVWSAIPWLPLGHLKNAENLRGRALPAQQPGFREPPPDQQADAEQDRATIAKRSDRLEPWIPKATWHRYEWAREVYAFSNLSYHQMERGFDYALTHHQIKVRHKLRKATAADSLTEQEPGEKCTLCGHRQALTGDDAPERDLDNSRAATRKFWSDPKLDPDENGKERLCAVCAMKRFLVDAAQDQSAKTLGSFNRLWAGPDTPFKDVADRDGTVRVPFPSTATLAAQAYLAKIVTEPSLEPYLAEVVSASHSASRTTFPRVLPQLAAAYRRAGASGKAFLEHEAQDVLFPEVIDGKLQGLKKQGKPGNAKQAQEQQEQLARLESLKRAVKQLRREAGRLLAEKSKNRIKPKTRIKPNTRIAVIKLDGDHMSRLLLGDGQAIGTRWRDVIHPAAVKQIEKSPHLLNAGWADLLDAKRLMGPSLHAFISRALANFSHRIVPWVVEMEFSGCLIYAGGDDVLCLAPAEEAVALAARLQQLFSAAWVVDTDYHADPWFWRRKDWEGDYDSRRARQRFAIPNMPKNEDPDGRFIRLPIENAALLQPPIGEENGWSPRLPVQGPLLPMLGPSASLSAGIAFAHYKTPMSVLMRQARHLLDDWAKERCGRRAVALSHYSRGGLKTEFVLPWDSSSRLSLSQPAYKILKQVQDAFRNGDLPSRLPYKLRELAPSACYALGSIQRKEMKPDQRQEAEAKLLRGLFEHCLEQPRSPITEAAFSLWRQGIDLHRPDPDRYPDDSDRYDRYTDGLLLCRSLAQETGDEQEEGEME